MADIVDKSTRSRMMSAIRGRNTAPEMAVRRALHRAGYRFRLHGRHLPGRPDIILPRHGLVILVHGCFWHGHRSCAFFKLPRTRARFWRTKIASNIKRDVKTVRQLRESGWRVLVVWECALRERPDAALQSVAAFVTSKEPFATIRA